MSYAASSRPSASRPIPLLAGTGAPSLVSRRQLYRDLSLRRLATRSGSTAEAKAIIENWGTRKKATWPGPSVRGVITQAPAMWRFVAVDVVLGQIMTVFVKTTNPL